jgi:hypothetical protein
LSSAVHHDGHPSKHKEVHPSGVHRKASAISTVRPLAFLFILPRITDTLLSKHCYTIQWSSTVNRVNRDIPTTMDQCTNFIQLCKSAKVLACNTVIQVLCMFALFSLDVLYSEDYSCFHPHLLVNLFSIASVFAHSIFSKRQCEPLHTELRSAYIRIADHESAYAKLEALHAGKETLLDDEVTNQRASRAMIRHLESELILARDSIRDLESALANSEATYHEKEAALDAESTHNQTLTGTIRYLENSFKAAMHETGPLRNTIAELEASCEDTETALTAEIAKHQVSRVTIQHLESRLGSASINFRKLRTIIAQMSQSPPRQQR